MEQVFDAEAARHALQEAQRLTGDSADSPETIDAWAHAAELHELGAEDNPYAASQAIHCFRKAKRWEDALRVGRSAVHRFDTDTWVRKYTAWAEYDRSKATDNTDETLDALRNMIELMRPLNDQGMFANSVFYRLRRFVPRDDRHAETAPPSVLDFLAEQFELLFNTCTIQPERAGTDAPGPSAKESLCHLALRAFRQAERWDDLSYAMNFATQMFPKISEFAVAHTTALMELGRPDEALGAADAGLVSHFDVELVRLKTRALTQLKRHADAEAELLAACYRIRDVRLWRDLAGVRWSQGDLAGSNRALAVALRVIGDEPAEVQREWEWRFHQGRAMGALRMGEVQTAVLEVEAACRTIPKDDATLDDSQLNQIIQSIAQTHSTALTRAEELRSDVLMRELSEIYATEREREIESVMRPGTVVWVDIDKGFGFLVLDDEIADTADTAACHRDGGGRDDNADADTDTNANRPAVPAWKHRKAANESTSNRVYFHLKRFGGAAEQVRVDLPIRALVPRPDPAPNSKREAILVRPLPGPTLAPLHSDAADLGSIAPTPAQAEVEAEAEMETETETET